MIDIISRQIKAVTCNAVLLLFSFVIESAVQLHVPSAVCLSETLADQQLSQLPSASPFPFQALLIIMPEIQKLAAENRKNSADVASSAVIQID